MKRRLNTEIRNRVFSLSANEVGGVGRPSSVAVLRRVEGEVARETQIPSPGPSPRLGGARGKAFCISKIHPCPSVVKK
jgi:hypothetical protein